MKRPIVPALALLAAAALWMGVTAQLPGQGAAPGAANRPAPEFPTADPALWFNSPPRTMASLGGQVVLLDVWTFG